MSSEETAPVRVALVDDQALIRSGWPCSWTRSRT